MQTSRNKTYFILKEKRSLQCCTVRMDPVFCPITTSLLGACSGSNTNYRSAFGMDTQMVSEHEFSQGGTDATTSPAEFSRPWHDSCESAVRYLEYSLKDYSLRTAARLPRPQVFAQNAPVLDHLLVGVLYTICIVCDECWKMSYDEESDATVWISIPVKPVRSMITCKCCTVYQIHVRQFNPCVTFHVFRNSQTSLFCLQAQSH